MTDLKVLMLSSECVPFAKTSGVADVVGSLPLALKRIGVDVRLALPHYSVIKAPQFQFTPLLEAFEIPPSVKTIPLSKAVMCSSL